MDAATVYGDAGFVAGALSVTGCGVGLTAVVA